ncbi:MAG: sigma-E processing peptidase SpoIIGA [Firmicutes bacterium]|nr:sigma-E processing peptidase SpoIIGA [Bacillota bacterium]
MVVYVDLAGMINLLIDSALLILTAALMRERWRWRRVLAAAALGSVYAVATLFPGTALLRTLLAKWLCSVVMVEMAFATGAWRTLSYRKWLKLLRQVAAFYGVTFALGGAVYAIHNLFAPASSPFAGLALVDGQVVWWTSVTTLGLVIALPVGLLIIRFAFTQVQKRQHDHARTCHVAIELFGHTVTVRALLDTGNELIDPITRMPVAVVHGEALLDLLPDSLATVLKSGGDPLQALYDNVDFGDLQSRIAIVPYRGVGGRGGQLLALRPDRVTIAATPDGAGFTVPRLLIALQQAPLTASDAYTCILPASAQSAFEEGRESVDTGSHTAVS